MAERKTLTRRVADVRALLEKNKAQLALALPRHITPDRMMRICMTAVQKTPKLLECDQISLFAAVIQAAQLGLEPDGALGQAWLVPFGNQVQLLPGYKGLLSLVRRSGELSTVEVRAVYARDIFRFRYGLASVLEHEPFNPGPQADSDEVTRGELVAVYAVARLRDGGIQWEVMRRHEVEAIRKRSRSGTSGPWVTDYDEMAKKTVLRRLCKLLPMSVEAQTAVDLDERAELGLPQDLEVPPGVVTDEPAGGSALDQLTDSLQAGKGGEVASEAPADVQASLLAESQP